MKRPYLALRLVGGLDTGDGRRVGERGERRRN
jgi:hypothetical protein